MLYIAVSLCFEIYLHLYITPLYHKIIDVQANKGWICYDITYYVDDSVVFYVDDPVVFYVDDPVIFYVDASVVLYIDDFYIDDYPFLRLYFMYIDCMLHLNESLLILNSCSAKRSPDEACNKTEMVKEEDEVSAVILSFSDEHNHHPEHLLTNGNKPDEHESQEIATYSTR